jgi:phenylpropionate dioxygenase-like ring-hydroxylating dioxygenase large terminal subunit
MLVSEVPALREYWYAVKYSSDLTDRPIPVRLFGEDFVLWRESPDGPARAAVDECPHRAARLSQGWLTNGCLTCPYHGWKFDGQGACVEIPSNEPGSRSRPVRASNPSSAKRSTAWSGSAWGCPARTSRSSRKRTIRHSR